MHKKTILTVNLICETAMDTKAHQEILQHFFPYHEAIHLNINQANRKIAVIYPIGYAPVADLVLSFFIRSKKQLYESLASLIYLAIQHLNKTHYHKAGIVLTITIPKMKRYHQSYKFGWKLCH